MPPTLRKVREGWGTRVLGYFERTQSWATGPIRNKVVIATKFGFDIDLQTGKRSGETNSKPEHIKRVASEKQCLNQTATDASKGGGRGLLARVPWAGPTMKELEGAAK